MEYVFVGAQLALCERTGPQCFVLTLDQFELLLLESPAGADELRVGLAEVRVREVVVGDQLEPTLVDRVDDVRAVAVGRPVRVEGGVPEVLELCLVFVVDSEFVLNVRLVGVVEYPVVVVDLPFRLVELNPRDPLPVGRLEVVTLGVVSPERLRVALDLRDVPSRVFVLRGRERLQPGLQRPGPFGE